LASDNLFHQGYFLVGTGHPKIRVLICVLEVKVVRLLKYLRGCNSTKGE